MEASALKERSSWPPLPRSNAAEPASSAAEKLGWRVRGQPHHDREVNKGERELSHPSSRIKGGRREMKVLVERIPHSGCEHLSRPMSDPHKKMNRTFNTLQESRTGRTEKEKSERTNRKHIIK